MDALEFIKQAKRMCRSYEDCEDCPARFDGYEDCHIDTTLNIAAEVAVDIVGKWALEHPEKTRQSEFLKLLPQNVTPKMNYDVLDICPAVLISEGLRGFCPRTGCQECKKEFWGEDMSQWR